MMLPRSIATFGAVVALLSALTSALPIPQQQTFSLEKRDGAGLDEPLEARLFFAHTTTTTKRATCPPPVVTRDVDDLDARDFDDELSARDEAVLQIRDHLDSILEKRDDDHLVLSMRDIADEDLALAIRSAWDNMSEVERRSWFSKAWNKVKSFGRKVLNTVKKVGSTVSNIAGKAGGVLNFASKFVGGGKFGSALSSISGVVNKVGAISGKAANLPRDYDEPDFDLRDVVDERDVGEELDIRSVPDEVLVLSAREAFEEMEPVERRDWVNTLARYL